MALVLSTSTLREIHPDVVLLMTDQHRLSVDTCLPADFSVPSVADADVLSGRVGRSVGEVGVGVLDPDVGVVRVAIGALGTRYHQE